MTKQDAELDHVLDGYERRDEQRQRNIDDRHAAEREFYAGFEKLVTDVIEPEMTRLLAKLTARGHQCSVEQEKASPTNEGYDRPGSIRFVFVPNQRYSQGGDDPAATFSAGSDRSVGVAYTPAVPVITDPAAAPRHVALADVTRELVSGQIVAMVRALL
jgi:hypothetical protein